MNDKNQINFKDPADVERMINDSHVFPLRKNRTAIMTIGVALFSGFSARNAWILFNNDNPVAAVFLVVFILFLVALLLIMFRQNLKVYHVSPEGISFIQPGKPKQSVVWTDVEDLAIERDATKFWVMEITGKDKVVIRIAEGMPRFQDLISLVQLLMAKNGKQDLVERIVQQNRN